MCAMLIKGRYPKTNKAARNRFNQEFQNHIELSSGHTIEVLWGNVLAYLKQRNADILAGKARFIYKQHPLKAWP